MTVLRNESALASLVDGRFADLVHVAVQPNPERVGRQASFLAARLATGAAALVALPVYLLSRGTICAAEVAVAGGLALCVVSAWVLMRTGRLVPAQGLASAGLAAMVVCLAAASGGLASPAAPWLLAVPADALPTYSRPAFRAALLATILATAILALVTLLGFEGDAQGLGALAPAAFALVGAAHLAAGTLALAARAKRTEIARPVDPERAALAMIDDLVTWHGATGNVLEASPAAERLLGLPAASLLGRGLLGRVHVSDRPTFLKAVSDAGAGALAVAAQFRLHVEAAAGEDSGPRVIWVEMRVRHVAEGAGGAAIVAVTRDVSEQRRRAEELEEARAEAERAEAVRSRFLATVSHELRTPLNAIIGFSEMMAGDLPLDAARRREYAQIVHGSGQHLLDVVNALLDMSRIQSGNFDFLPESLDAAGLIEGCCGLMRLKAEEAGVTLVREVAGGLPEIVADPRACRQMLINLISNAIKFTPRGGRVTVSLRRAFHRIELSVADTGIGVAADDLPRLGDPFFQAGAGYSRRHEGTGLGLSVVRGLVGLHQGEMTIESGAGAGTCVTLSLPIDCRGSAAPLGTLLIRTTVRTSAPVTVEAPWVPPVARLFG